MDKAGKKRLKNEYNRKVEQSFYEKLISLNVTLFPEVIDVFANHELGCYFKPLLTYPVTVNSKEYFIHLLGTDGLFPEAPFQYSENGLWGFDYNNGKYLFKGELRIFGASNVQDVYSLLKNDFEDNKDRDMVCCGTDGHRFMSLNGLMSFGFLNTKHDMVYILEYGS